jgi:hypothetical protein
MEHVAPPSALEDAMEWERQLVSLDALLGELDGDWNSLSPISCCTSVGSNELVYFLTLPEFFDKMQVQMPS